MLTSTQRQPKSEWLRSFARSHRASLQTAASPPLPLASLFNSSFIRCIVAVGLFGSRQFRAVRDSDPVFCFWVYAFCFGLWKKATELRRRERILGLRPFGSTALPWGQTHAHSNPTLCFFCSFRIFLNRELLKGGGIATLIFWFLI